MRASFKYVYIFAFCFIAVLIFIYFKSSHDGKTKKIKGASHLIHRQPSNAILKNPQFVEDISEVKQRQPLKRFGKEFSVTNDFINIFDETGENIKADCVTLRVTNPGFGNSKICIHNTSDDAYVSGSLRTKGQWEGGTLTAFGNILISNPDLLVLDVGSQVGTYTLYANKLGAKVIAVDAFKKNLQLLSKSLHLIYQEENVILLWNAMVNHHGKLILEFRSKNIGGTRVHNETDGTMRPKEANYAVQGIKFDDLVDAFDLEDKKVFIKIDIEGSELIAFQGGHYFFSRVKVCYLFMEFISYTKNGKGKLVVDFLSSYGLYPYSDPYLKNSLEGVHPNKFKFDVFFTRKDGLCSK